MSSRSLSTLADRIQRKVSIQADGCYVWTGAMARGYGRIHLDDKMHCVHRLTYTIWRGPIPPGLQLDHLCRNRACCNPLHLEQVTASENVRRGLSPQLARERFTKTHCLRGHALNDNSVYRYPGERKCRECTLINSRNQKARLRAARLGVSDGI